MLRRIAVLLSLAAVGAVPILGSNFLGLRTELNEVELKALRQRVKLTSVDCINTDTNPDSYGDDCTGYARHPGWCGHVDPNFNSNVLCCACGGGRLPPPPPRTDRLDIALESMFNDWKLLGASVAVFKRGAYTKPIVYGYGRTSSQPTSAPVTGDTPLMIASISKTILGSAVQRLFDLGVVKPDDDIKDVLPPELAKYPNMYRNPRHPDTPVTWRYPPILSPTPTLTLTSSSASPSPSPSPSPPP